MRALCSRLLLLTALGAVVPALLPTGVWAGAEATMALCRNAAIRAADAHGVPREVMLAITTVETRTRRGGATGPWPWTVNVAGKGAWFDSRAAALVHAQGALEAGQTSFDVGCFQINYRWHGRHFASIDQMFEPSASGDYAARFLKSLYAETGDWVQASGYYHSRTAEHAKRYRAMVARAVKALDGKAGRRVALAASPAATLATPLILRVDRDQRWPLAPGRVRTPTGMGESAGGVRLNALRRGGGRLIGGG